MVGILVSFWDDLFSGGYVSFREGMANPPLERHDSRKVGGVFRDPSVTSLLATNGLLKPLKQYLHEKYVIRTICFPCIHYIFDMCLLHLQYLYHPNILLPETIILKRKSTRGSLLFGRVLPPSTCTSMTNLRQLENSDVSAPKLKGFVRDQKDENPSLTIYKTHTHTVTLHQI